MEGWRKREKGRGREGERGGREGRREAEGRILTMYMNKSFIEALRTDTKHCSVYQQLMSGREESMPTANCHYYSTSTMTIIEFPGSRSISDFGFSTLGNMDTAMLAQNL